MSNLPEIELIKIGLGIKESGTTDDLKSLKEEITIASDGAVLDQLDEMDLIKKGFGVE